MASEHEEVESGYGPGTRPGDNVTNDAQQETAASFRALARARGDRVTRIDGVLTTTDASLPLPFWNRAVLEAPITDAAPIVRALREFYADGAGPFLLDSAWPTPDLRSQGFTLMGHPPLMLRAAGVPLPAPPPDLRIERVGTDRARDMELTLVDGYPAPMFQPFEGVRMFTPSTFDADGWHHYVGYADGQPVAAGSAYVGPQLVRVENIATLPAARGRGFGAAITAATIATDLSKPAVLVASELGRPVYEKLGFTAIARMTYWIGKR